jgi:hypothetical protein
MKNEDLCMAALQRATHEHAASGMWYLLSIHIVMNLGIESDTNRKAMRKIKVKKEVGIL